MEGSNYYGEDPVPGSSSHFSSELGGQSGVSCVELGGRVGRWKDNCDGEDPVPGSSSDLSCELGVTLM